uniref:Uncharacterized protein n=1 Tax=Arundo donax TaxID=35708 RepID=A0A0A9GCE6_ARUDO
MDPMCVSAVWLFVGVLPAVLVTF